MKDMILKHVMCWTAIINMVWLVVGLKQVWGFEKYSVLALQSSRLWVRYKLSEDLNQSFQFQCVHTLIFLLLCLWGHLCKLFFDPLRWICFTKRSPLVKNLPPKILGGRFVFRNGLSFKKVFHFQDLPIF